MNGFVKYVLLPLTALVMYTSCSSCKNDKEPDKKFGINTTVNSNGGIDSTLIIKKDNKYVALINNGDNKDLVDTVTTFNAFNVPASMGRDSSNTKTFEFYDKAYRAGVQEYLKRLNAKALEIVK
jgi:hypothetical protein